MAITEAELHELIHQTSHGASEPNARLREFAKRVTALLGKANEATTATATTCLQRLAELKTLLDGLRSVPPAPIETNPVL